MYGPTETTIDCAAMHLTREYRDDEPIPIGRACRNKQIILLKDDLTEAQPGEPGEICVRGSGVAAGYFADPAKTDAAFIQNPLCPDFRDILYRTGDMAVLREDGYLYFLAVSYTHLDVYKRQPYITSDTRTMLDRSDELMEGARLVPVSYTHLDVYKRQELPRARHRLRRSL